MQPAGPVPLITMGCAAAKSARRQRGDHKTMFTADGHARVVTLAATQLPGSMTAGAVRS